ncbi:MAG: DUF2855 family protein [bacterium]|nr:DUF2855 family protein [bacterium]
MPDTDFMVNKSDWKDCRFLSAEIPAEIEEGQALLRVDRFAFTANNISYCLAGDSLNYWNFYPAPEGWGRIPTMGFGDVIQSKHPDVAVGQRVFGFFPMSKYLIVQPAATGDGFTDTAAHRAETAPVYRQYSRTDLDPNYDPAREDQIALMRGLFMTSFLVDDYIADNDHFGARAALVSSASSKTSIALGFLLSKRGHGPVIGLTSASNASFVESLGFYDRVVTYDQITSVPNDVPSVFVDMAGNAEFKSALHHHFGDQLKLSCSVGATHWEKAGGGNVLSGGGADLPGPKPEFFFAPGQIQKRAKDWGPAGLQERIGQAWGEFANASDNWLKVVRGYGPSVVEKVFKDTLEGRCAPNEGHVISVWDNELEASGR